MAQRDNKEAYDVGEKIGELKGTQAAMLAQLSSIKDELVRMASETDKRHDQNLKLIADRHEENRKLITDHKADDEKNFLEVRKLCWMIVYSFIASSFTLGVIWTLFQFLFPLLKKS